MHEFFSTYIDTGTAQEFGRFSDLIGKDGTIYMECSVSPVDAMTYNGSYSVYPVGHGANASWSDYHRAKDIVRAMAWDKHNANK